MTTATAHAFANIAFTKCSTAILHWTNREACLRARNNLSWLACFFLRQALRLIWNWICRRVNR